jgi:hypothetical protein
MAGIELSDAKDALMRGHLLEGETLILRKEHTQLWITGKSSLKGSLLVTPYRLLFLCYTKQSQGEHEVHSCSVPFQAKQTFASLQPRLIVFLDVCRLRNE